MMCFFFFLAPDAPSQPAAWSGKSELEHGAKVVALDGADGSRGPKPSKGQTGGETNAQKLHDKAVARADNVYNNRSDNTSFRNTGQANRYSTQPQSIHQSDIVPEISHNVQQLPPGGSASSRQLQLDGTGDGNSETLLGDACDKDDSVPIRSRVNALLTRYGHNNAFGSTDSEESLYPPSTPEPNVDTRDEERLRRSPSPYSDESGGGSDPKIAEHNIEHGTPVGGFIPSDSSHSSSTHPDDDSFDDLEWDAEMLALQQQLDRGKDGNVDLLQELRSLVAANMDMEYQGGQQSPPEYEVHYSDSLPHGEARLLDADEEGGQTEQDLSYLRNGRFPRMFSIDDAVSDTLSVITELSEPDEEDDKSSSSSDKTPEADSTSLTSISEPDVKHRAGEDLLGELSGSSTEVEDVEEEIEDMKFRKPVSLSSKLRTGLSALSERYGESDSSSGTSSPQTYSPRQEIEASHSSLEQRADTVKDTPPAPVQKLYKEHEKDIKREKDTMKDKNAKKVEIIENQRHRLQDKDEDKLMEKRGRKMRREGGVTTIPGYDLSKDRKRDVMDKHKDREWMDQNQPTTSESENESTSQMSELSATESTQDDHQLDKDKDHPDPKIMVRRDTITMLAEESMEDEELLDFAEVYEMNMKYVEDTDELSPLDDQMSQSPPGGQISQSPPSRKTPLSVDKEKKVKEKTVEKHYDSKKEHLKALKAFQLQKQQEEKTREIEKEQLRREKEQERERERARRKEIREQDRQRQKELEEQERLREEERKEMQRKEHERKEKSLIMAEKVGTPTSVKIDELTEKRESILREVSGRQRLKLIKQKREERLALERDNGNLDDGELVDESPVASVTNLKSIFDKPPAYMMTKYVPRDEEDEDSDIDREVYDRSHLYTGTQETPTKSYTKESSQDRLAKEKVTATVSEEMYSKPQKYLEDPISKRNLGETYSEIHIDELERPITRRGRTPEETFEDQYEKHSMDRPYEKAHGFMLDSSEHMYGIDVDTYEGEPADSSRKTQRSVDYQMVERAARSAKVRRTVHTEKDIPLDHSMVYEDTPEQFRPKSKRNAETPEDSSDKKIARIEEKSSVERSQKQRVDLEVSAKPGQSDEIAQVRHERQEAAIHAAATAIHTTRNNTSDDKDESIEDADVSKHEEAIEALKSEITNALRKLSEESVHYEEYQRSRKTSVTSLHSTPDIDMVEIKELEHEVWHSQEQPSHISTPHKTGKQRQINVDTMAKTAATGKSQDVMADVESRHMLKASPPCQRRDIEAKSPKESDGLRSERKEVKHDVSQGSDDRLADKTKETEVNESIEFEAVFRTNLEETVRKSSEDTKIVVEKKDSEKTESELMKGVMATSELHLVIDRQDSLDSLDAELSPSTIVDTESTMTPGSAGESDSESMGEQGQVLGLECDEGASTQGSHSVDYTTDSVSISQDSSNLGSSEHTSMCTDIMEGRLSVDSRSFGTHSESTSQSSPGSISQRSTSQGSSMSGHAYDYSMSFNHSTNLDRSGAVSFNSLDVLVDEDSDTAGDRANPENIDKDFALSLNLGPPPDPESPRVQRSRNIRVRSQAYATTNLSDNVSRSNTSNSPMLNIPSQSPQQDSQQGTGWSTYFCSFIFLCSYKL